MLSISNVVTNNSKGIHSDTRFSGDREYIEDMSSFDSSLFIEIEVGAKHLIGVQLDGNVAYLVNLNIKEYAGEEQESISIQELTLEGTYSFLRNTDVQLEQVSSHYTAVLRSNKIDVTFEDVLELAVYNPEYGVSTLALEDESTKVWITVKDGLLKKITKKINTHQKSVSKESLKDRLFKRV